jgi:hypothetical protein
MKMRALTYLAVIAFGCNAQAGENAVQATTEQSKVQSKLDALGRDAVKRKCVRPLKITRQRIANTHEPDVIDEIQKYFCDGFEITLYRANAFKPHRELPLALVVHRSLPSLSSHLSVGAPISGVRSALGPPTKIDNGNLIYDLSEGMDDSITFKVSNGKVKSISWAWDVD